MPVYGGVVLAEPREAKDDRTVSQAGDIQGKGFGMVARSSDLGWEETGDRTGSRRAAVNELNL